MKIILPLSVPMPTKKQPDKGWILNLNSYRNTHFQILNKAKVLWKDTVLKAICPSGGPLEPHRWIPPPPFRFGYTVYPGSNRKFDTSNVCSIIDKFTCDALIDFGIIPDDSYKVIPEITYKFGGLDKANPRVELTIESYEGLKYPGEADLPF